MNADDEALERLTDTAAAIAEQDGNGVEVEDIFPERPRPKRHITLHTDIRGCRGGVKEAMWVQTGPQYVGTVRVGIPRPEGFVDAVVPIDMLREALDKLEEFDPNAERED